jgi:hypothetical protein
MISMISQAAIGYDHLAPLRRRDARLVTHETFVECPVCGFEPPTGFRLPADHCLKCGADCWRRAVRPVTSTLPQARRIHQARVA